jgi:hypothetical protein
MFKLNKNKKKELEILRNELEEYKKTQNAAIQNIQDHFNAKLFVIKYPNGTVEKCYEGYYSFSTGGFYSNNKNIVYKYTAQDNIKEIKLTHISDALVGYKICLHNDVIYIGVKSESEEKYFAVDISKELSIEIENSGLEEMDKKDWVK